MTYSVSWPENTFLAEFSGVVTAEEIEAVNNAFGGDARMETIRYSIWYFSHATEFAVPQHAIENAAAFDKGASVSRPSLRGAMIVTDRHVKACIEEYLAIAADLGIQWDTRVVADKATAKAWLEGAS